VTVTFSRKTLVHGISYFKLVLYFFGKINPTCTEMLENIVLKLSWNVECIMNITQRTHLRVDFLERVVLRAFTGKPEMMMSVS